MSCRFCGRDSAMLASDSCDPKWYHVECRYKSCQAHGPLRRSAKGAWAAWNKEPKRPAWLSAGVVVGKK